MPSFLERYQLGEHEQVWRDLGKLGARVRDEQFLADAEGVARETMKRARDNAETIVTRLEKLGYQFISTQDEQIRAFENMRRAGQVTDALGAAMEKIMAAGAPTVAQLLAQREKLAQAHATLVAEKDAREKPPAIAPPHASMADHLAEYEATIGGPLPLSIRSWCETVGSVSLLGTHPELCPRMARREPVLFLTPGSQAYIERKMAQLLNFGVTDASDIPEPPLADPLIVSCQLYVDQFYVDSACPNHHLILGPDEMYKAGTSGDGTGDDMYWIDVPNANADAPFEEWHATSFVDYLRIAFRWGGFPGWERYPQRPQKELSYLAEGLLPL